MVSILPLISHPTCLSFKLFETSTLITVCIQALVDLCKRTNYNWYHRQPHIPQFFFSYLAKFKHLYLFSFIFARVWEIASLIKFLGSFSEILTDLSHAVIWIHPPKCHPSNPHFQVLGNSSKLINSNSFLVIRQSPSSCLSFCSYWF